MKKILELKTAYVNLVIPHTNTQAHTDPSNKVTLGKILGYENGNNCEEDSSSYRIWRHEVVFGGGKKIF